MVSAASRMSMALRVRDANFSLPQSFYVDPAFHQLDLELIFYREWLFAGHSCEIPDRGDYLTLQVGAYPVLIVRGQDGSARAFHNLCRHRGQQLCAKAKGSSPKLVCPYHQWTYELDGRLFFARDMKGETSGSSMGLKPVACGEFGGYIFISLADQPSDFDAFRAAVEPYVRPHSLSNAKVAFESTIVERGNWKLVMENNRECYHCRGSHPGLSRVFSDRPALTGVDEVGADEAVVGHWKRCEVAGLPSRFSISATGQYRVVRIPLTGTAESMTMSGQAASRRRLAEFPAPGIGSLLLFHYPSTWNHLLADHAVSFRILPLGPMETQVTTKWLVNREAREDVDYDIERLTEVWKATNDEDRRLVESNQRGILSPAYEPGPYSRLHEDGVIQFVNWYAATASAGLESLQGCEIAPRMSA